MMCYLDKSFCEKDDCRQWKKCDRALTETHRHKAEAYGLHVSIIADPECYDPKTIRKKGRKTS